MYQDVNFCIPTEIDAIEGRISIGKTKYTGFSGWFCGAIRFFCFLLTMPR